MKVTLYQMRADADNARLLFLNLQYVKTVCGDHVPAECYEVVFSGELDVETPEDVFYIFNVAHPKGYNGRSMSVSDVVEFSGSDGISTFFYCEPVGFAEIKFDKGKILEGI